jgi:DNA repair protein RadC
MEQCQPGVRYFEVSKGGISGASADVRIVFAAALKANATGIILAHNHPFG